MSTLNNPHDILRAALFSGEAIHPQFWAVNDFDIEVLEYVYSLIKPRMDYLRGYTPMNNVPLGHERHQAVQLVKLAAFDEEDVERVHLDVLLTRKGTWYVRRFDITEPEQGFGDLRHCIEHIEAVIAGFDLFSRHPHHNKGGYPIRSIALALADGLLAVLAKSVQVKQDDLDGERRILEQLQPLLNRFHN